jgi:GTPase Era involved in 16S rRNA processing
VEGPIFSFKQYRELVANFARDIPRLLARHPRTADLALEIEKLRLEDVLEAQFTVAVIGQMRSGKSTLLNALIGKDLSPVAVNETTATINWFRHAEHEEDEQIFRVHWHGGEVTEHPISQVGDWIGRSENAIRTAYMELFARSPFLKRAVIVDTPGTRAAVQQHQTTADEFLAEKLEQQTLICGGRADAVLYVINPVAREKDLQLLTSYGQRTRLPGSSPQNSIAVVQKWEHLGDSPLPEARAKCARMREQFTDQVAEVIPTSGLLARLADRLPGHVFDSIVKLATKTEPRELRDLMSDAGMFTDEEDIHAALSIEERRALAKVVPWPALSLGLRFSRDQHLESGEALRGVLHQASGVDELRRLLSERFFAKAELIKANTILRKAFDPIRQALLRLREVEDRRRRDRNRGERILALLEDESPRFSAMREVGAFIEEAIASYAGDGKEASALLSSLAELQTRIEDSFGGIEADVKALDMLAGGAAADFDEAEKKELRTLFGGSGQEPWQRLGLLEKPRNPTQAESAAEERLTHWNGRTHRCRGQKKTVCEMAVMRYSQIIDGLLTSRSSIPPKEQKR